MKSFLHSLFHDAGKRDKLRASLPAQTVIRGRSADNRKALLNSRCPLSEWKFCIGFPRADKLADSRILCRMRAEQAVSDRSSHKYQSAGRERTGTCRTVWLLPQEGAGRSPEDRFEVKEELTPLSSVAYRRHPLPVEGGYNTTIRAELSFRAEPRNLPVLCSPS